MINTANYPYQSLLLQIRGPPVTANASQNAYYRVTFVSRLIRSRYTPERDKKVKENTMAENGPSAARQSNAGHVKMGDEASEAKPVKNIDLDYVLVNELGQFGRFQLNNILLVAIPTIMSAFMNEYIFSAAAIPHR